MQAIRRLVEIVMYGVGDQRRYVQDGAVFAEVWIMLIAKNGKDVPILVQPYKDLPPPILAEALTERGITRKKNGVVYNNTIVSLHADLATLVFGLVPMTSWFSKSTSFPAVDAESRTFTDIVDDALRGNLWADLALGGAESAPTVANELLSFIRIAGVAAYFTLGKKRRADVNARVIKELAHLMREPPGDVHADVATLVRNGWDLLMRPVNVRPFQTGGRPDCIYSITCDRPAFLSVADSRKAIKADAATRLFDLSCQAITWAIIDSGIDASHPAFIPLSKKQDDPKAAPETADGRLARSRVSKTYDLIYLREILLGEDASKLPRDHLARSQPQLLRKVRDRADSFQPIDWGLLLPLLQVKSTVPAIPHGTHVAGILGADWLGGPRNGMQGLCPNINMIDVRVCKPDGSSDEFVLTAALQLLRYLNAHADLMAVHGVNISLSLEHDVANYACGRTPICLEAERTMASGIVVVAAAGNRGYRHIRAADESTFYQYAAVSITDPGNAEAIITVGSTHRREPHNFGVSYFSSRGPTGDGRIKPDLVAPGEKIYAPAPNGTAMTLDGTSMAAPHVSGAAALLLARNTELFGQAARVKQILCETATDLGRERYFQGHGLVDVLRALQSI